MKNITVTVSTDTYCRVRIWAAKHATSVLRIAAKTARQIAEQTPAGIPPKFSKSAVKLWTPATSTTCGHSFTVPQFLEAHHQHTDHWGNSTRIVEASHTLGSYTEFMAVRIAIPEPTSDDLQYNERTLLQYVSAVKAAGAEPVVVQLSEAPERIANLLAGVHGVLLPGSPHDVDPQRYGEARVPECADDDPARTAADELLLQDAFNLRKPILAICHGTQNLNVWRNGSLVQDLKTTVNHQPGREVAKAHPVRITEGSRLAQLLSANSDVLIPVNSSHHQAIQRPGDNLRVTAVSSGDRVIEAIELDAPDHFVLGVQWHPERTYEQSSASRAIFSAFVRAAAAWRPPKIEPAANGK